VVEGTQKGIARALRRWATLRAERERIEAERDQTIEPIRARFERQIAPAVARAEEQLTPLRDELSKLEKEITEAMKANIVGGEVRLPRVSTSVAVAEVVTRSEREIDAREFFESVPVAKRGDAFYSCLKIQIGKAEKFLGERITDLAHFKRTHTITVRAVAQKGSE
jgi:hypothetical protein